jgi:TonB family protein
MRWLVFLLSAVLWSQQGNITGAKIKKKVQPIYTKRALESGIEGRVTLSALINQDGTVKVLKVLTPAGYGLDEAAMVAVSQWEYEPAKLNGKPLSTLTKIEVNFMLNRVSGVDEAKFKRMLDARERYNVGVRLLKSGHLRAAQEKFEGAAKDNLVPAQLALAKLLSEEGSEVRDPQSAAMWAKRAADMDAAEGCHLLGTFYRSGIGVEQNRPEAAKLFKRAVGLGWPASAFELGLLYESDALGKPDLVEAMDQYRKAAEKDFAPAQMRLGVLLAASPDSGKRTEGLMWLLLSKQGGYSPASGVWDREAAKASAEEMKKAVEQAAQRKPVQ